MIFFRKIVFYLFCILYLVTCPILLLYAFGFIVKPGAEYGIVKTGLIYLSTVPSNAQVFVGTSRYARKTPVMIRDLMPGSYTLKVVQPGYRPWVQTVPVEAEKASALDYVLLLPSSWKVHRISAESFSELEVIPDSGFGLLKRGDHAADFWAVDFEEDEVTPLFREDSPWAQAKIRQVFTGKESSLVIFVLETTKGLQYWAVDLAKPEKSPRDLTLLFPEPPVQIRWEKNHPEYAFVLQGADINRLNLQDGELKPSLLREVRGLGVEDGNLYALRRDGLVVRFDKNGKDDRFLLEDPALAHSLFGDAGNYRIEAWSSDLMILMGEKGDLISNRLPYKLVEAGVLGVDYFRKGRRLLVWKKDRVGIVDFSREKSPGSEMFEKGPRLRWIFQKGNSVSQAFWVYEGSHILFRDGNHVYLLDTETYGEPEVLEIVKVREGTAVYYHEENGHLYYLNEESGRLESIEILPKKAVINFPFPERREGTVVREKNQNAI